MRRAALLVLLASAVAATSSVAQQSAAPPASEALNRAAVTEVVRAVIKTVAEDYVFPDRTPRIVARLERGLASGRYATSNPQILAGRMTEDLREASNNDGHMYINYRPYLRQAAEAPAGGPPARPDIAAYERDMAMSNHGVTELKVLPGNVRYMKLSRWFWDPAGKTEAALADALKFLRGGDAIIIDVQDNGGGSGQAVQFVTSHFIDPERKLITLRQGPKMAMEVQSRAVPGGRISGKPLLVLVGPGSASASEEFAAHVKYFRLGTLVGQTTAGAANPNSLYGMPHGFELSVSTGTAVHAVTGKGWEGEGIAADREVELAQSLDAAHLAALQAQLASAPADRRGELEWLIAALSADGRSSLSEAQRTALAGTYEGNRRIFMRDGKLYWQRPDRPQQAMIPLGGRLFALGDRFGPRAEVEPDGRALRILRPGEEPERVARISGS